MVNRSRGSGARIEPLERVRRIMNCNLVALHEDLNMLSRFPGRDAARKAAAAPPGGSDRACRASVRSGLHQAEEGLYFLFPGR
jgi:hypothetical protein